MSSTGNSSRYLCPITTSCDWFYEVPEHPEIKFSPDGSLSVGAEAFEAHAKAIETACRDHYETHTVEDWLREIMTLRAQSSQQPTLACGLCISDARNAEARKQPVLPILPATTVHSGIAVCDAEGRHRIVAQSGILRAGQNGFGPAGMN